MKATKLKLLQTGAMLLILCVVLACLFPLRHRVKADIAGDDGYHLMVDISNYDYLVKDDDFGGNVDLTLGDEVRNYWPMSRFDENADGVSEVKLMRLNADGETHVQAELDFIPGEYFIITEGDEVYEFAVK